jgi:hypothetical protein
MVKVSASKVNGTGTAELEMVGMAKEQNGIECVCKND